MLVESGIKIQDVARHLLKREGRRAEDNFIMRWNEMNIILHNVQYPL